MRSKGISRDRHKTLRGDISLRENCIFVFNAIRWLTRLSYRISAWFVKEDTKENDGKEVVDYLFHDLEFKQTERGWTAQGDHLCNLDMCTYYLGRTISFSYPPCALKLLGVIHHFANKLRPEFATVVRPGFRHSTLEDI